MSRRNKMGEKSGKAGGHRRFTVRVTAPIYQALGIMAEAYGFANLQPLVALYLKRGLEADVAMHAGGNSAAAMLAQMMKAAGEGAGVPFSTNVPALPAGGSNGEANGHDSGSGLGRQTARNGR